MALKTQGVAQFVERRAHQPRLVATELDRRGDHFRGEGAAGRGRAVSQDRCGAGHGADGEGGEGTAGPLAGGIGTLASDKPLKTVGSYWPHATTIFDYVRRAMPYDRPMSLSNDDV